MTGKVWILGCSQCNQYSKAAGRCKLGKINPKTYKGMKDAVNWFGLNYICKQTERGDKWINRLINETCTTMLRKENPNGQYSQD